MSKQDLNGRDELREQIERLIGTAILKNDKNYTNDIMTLIEADRVRIEKGSLKIYITEAIELLKTFRPARPEDLSMSQWHGLVLAIDAAIAEGEKQLAELQSNSKGEQ